MKRVLPLAGGVTSALFLGFPVFAADQLGVDVPEVQQCAVSALNGKVEGAGGNIDNDIQDGGRYYGAASISLPVGCLFGAQIDFSAGELDDESTWGVAGHFFTRDPSSYLLGVYGEVAGVGDNDISRIALEGELYRDEVTFSGIIGFEDSDFTDDELFAAGDIAFYVDDNFQISGGFSHFLDVSSANVGFEWQPDDTNVSFFAEGAFGDNDHTSVLGGIRIYFGEQKSLIRRHREDDPKNWINRLQTITNVAASSPCGPGETLVTPSEGPPFCIFLGSVD